MHCVEFAQIMRVLPLLSSGEIRRSSVDAASYAAEKGTGQEAYVRGEKRKRKTLEDTRVCKVYFRLQQFLLI